MKMMKGVSLNTYLSNYSLVVLLNLLFAVLTCLEITGAQNCGPSGNVTGTQPPPGKCNRENNSQCCKPGHRYSTFTCSPHPNHQAILTLNGFGPREDGGSESKCDNRFHNNNTPIVALSTGWFGYRNQKRCMHNIAITGNGKTVTAMVVDECDSTRGCDKEHAYQPPCHNNIVDASKAVWTALGVPEGSAKYGHMHVTWVDA
ncbi:hypothetical protein C5167_036507 [Papaver somniferum]|uniref:Ripening-related protein 1 n=1 Tax=Papaver somniferum TaxID=3469 RepID=A0A4Y7I6V5_PAPSO|nr:putative ripening-related protein 1 [Papaver somniferum]RZC43560.1 hypothetical protein C5167_036507 [Papaver somniferum]